MKYIVYRYRRKSTGSVFYRIEYVDPKVHEEETDESLTKKFNVSHPGQKEGWEYDNLWGLEDEGQIEQRFTEHPWPLEITVDDLA